MLKTPGNSEGSSLAVTRPPTPPRPTSLPSYANHGAIREICIQPNFDAKMFIQDLHKICGSNLLQGRVCYHKMRRVYVQYMLSSLN
jgi:hypothetical protein